MKTRALAKRILKQLSHDKRTLALMLIAPLLLLTLIYFIFESANSDIQIGTVNIPANFEERLSADSDNIKLVTYKTEKSAKEDLRNGDINAYIAFPEDFPDEYLEPVFNRPVTADNVPDLRASVMVDETSGSKGAVALTFLKTAKLDIVGELPLEYDIDYLDGIEDLSMFDQFGSTLIGFMVFFFVFLVGGMAFLKERKSGTLERLLSTPVKRRQIIFGYIIGFGIVTVIQSIFISFYAVYVLKIMMVGSMWFVLLITLLSSLCALTFGMLISTLASSEFQVMQFVPLVIIPQLFFSGLFDLSSGWLTFGKIFPLTYITDALQSVMFKDEGITGIGFDLLVVFCFITVFMFLNTQLLKKYRRI